MTYSQVLFKDKKDITPVFKSLFLEASYLGAMSKLTYNPNIKILSVLFSYVGIKTLNALPNLKYIVSRSHGIEKINSKLCKERNIVVYKVNPFIDSVSNYIIDNIKKYNFEEPYCFYGFGSINKAVFDKLKPNKFYVVVSKTKQIDISWYLKNSRTIILAVSSNKSTKNLFNRDKFIQLSQGTNLISISRHSVIDNSALLWAVKNNFINLAIIDTLSSSFRDKLLETKRVSWTNHAAWSFNLNESEYPKRIKEVIDSCLADKPMNVVSK